MFAPQRTGGGKTDWTLLRKSPRHNNNFQRGIKSISLSWDHFNMWKSVVSPYIHVSYKKAESRRNFNRTKLSRVANVERGWRRRENKERGISCLFRHWVLFFCFFSGLPISCLRMSTEKPREKNIILQIGSESPQDRRAVSFQPFLFIIYSFVCS